MADAELLAAALLHDTIEDTATTEEELRKAFGTRIAGIVVELTDDKRLSKAERKRLQLDHAAQVSKDAQQLKIADKLCNLREILSSPPADWPLFRKYQYFDWAKAVVDQVRDRIRASPRSSIALRPALEALACGGESAQFPIVRVPLIMGAWEDTKIRGTRAWRRLARCG